MQLLIRYSSFFLLILLFSNGITAQKNKSLAYKNYIPTEGASFTTHPTVEIKTIIHVIKRSEQQADNLTEDSLGYIKQQFEWINLNYDRLAKPSLKVDGQVHHIPSARVEFKIVDIEFHTDEQDWDRIKTMVEFREKNPIQIIEANPANNQLIVKGSWTRNLKSYDSLRIVDSKNNDGVYTFSSTQEKNGLTYITLNSTLTDSSTGHIAYYKELNKNCSKDVWSKYTNEDKTHLHIFYTGSSKSGIAFGCGPSPYFLNVSNIIKGGDWAGAQLTAHELGHTLGLKHTDFPQFSDLPKQDKFGFIPCNNNNTSNNIMGYNQCRDYLSPLQVGYVHYLYSTKPDRIILTTANEYQPDNNIEIWDSTHWEKNMVVRGDIIVRKKQVLYVTHQVHMAAGASIYLEKNAKLIVEETGLITNYFGSKWNGITICKSYERKNKKPCKPNNYGVVILKKTKALQNFRQE